LAIATFLARLALLPLALSACAAGPDRPATDPRVIEAIRVFYNMHAAEAGCNQPVLVMFRSLTITHAQGFGDTLRMRAVYDFEQREPQTGGLVCDGTGTRHLSVLRTVDGPRVLGMSGRKRAGVP
jgi:hypothetical protein